MNVDNTKSNTLNQQLEEARKETSYSANNLVNKMKIYLSDKNSELKVRNITIFKT